MQQHELLNKLTGDAMQDDIIARKWCEEKKEKLFELYAVCDADKLLISDILGIDHDNNSNK